MYRVRLATGGERSREAWESPDWKLEVGRGRRWMADGTAPVIMLWSSVGSLQSPVRQSSKELKPPFKSCAFPSPRVLSHCSPIVLSLHVSLQRPEFH